MMAGDELHHPGGKNAPHVLAFPFPIPGHMNSLMYACTHLASSCGFIVTYACNRDNYKLMVKTRDLIGSSIDSVRVVPFDDGVSSYKSQKSNPSENLELPIVTARGMRAPLEELIQSFIDQGNPVACIITDTFNGWVQDVANKFQIPKAAFWTSNAINDILHLALPELVAKGFVPVASRKRDVPITFLAGLPPMPPTDLPLSFYFDHPIIEYISDGARRFPEAQYCLSNTIEELEPDAIAIIRKHIKSDYYPVGPCLSTSFFAESSALSRSTEVLSLEDLACLNWLDNQPQSSVIYVSFGSVATMSVEQFQDLAIGLERSKQRFLLVLRKTLVSDESVFNFFSDFQHRTRDRGFVVAWAPQMHVLLHPAVGGFLTHCGWNSTLEGICAGKPMLAWPCMAEQNVNCRELVNRWKLAIEVKDEEEFVGGRISDKAVAKLVEKIMVGEEGAQLRIRAAEFREIARTAVAEGGSSDRNLKAFAQSIRDRIEKPAAAID